MDEDAREYLLYTESYSKTFHGGVNNRKKMPRTARAYANPDVLSTCPVHIYRQTPGLLSLAKRCNLHSLQFAFLLLTFDWNIHHSHNNKIKCEQKLRYKLKFKKCEIIYLIIFTWLMIKLLSLNCATIATLFAKQLSH